MADAQPWRGNYSGQFRTPDAPPTTGVPLHRMEHGVYVPPAAPSLIDHIAYPVALDAARSRVIEAVRWATPALQTTPMGQTVLRELTALDALTQEAGS